MVLCKVGGKEAASRDVKVRARVPLMWMRTIYLKVGKSPTHFLVELELVIASPGAWRKLTTCAENPEKAWWSGRYGPFVVGLRPSLVARCV